VCVCSSRRYIETSRRRPTRGIFVGGDGGRSNICGPPRYAERPLIIDGFGLFTRHFAHCIGYLFFSLTHAAKSPRTRTVALTHTHTHTHIAYKPTTLCRYEIWDAENDGQLIAGHSNVGHER